MKFFVYSRSPERSLFLVGAYLLLFFLVFSGPKVSAQVMTCTSDEKTLVKWDFESNDQACNGITASRGLRRFWKPTVPLMTGGNSYCPQINDGSGQALIFQRGFGNTNDFKGAMCLAGFWRNRGNQYHTAPGYDPGSDTYNPDNPSGNVWLSYEFLPGQAGTLTGFDFTYIQSGYRDGKTIAFDEVGISVYRNGVRIYLTTLPIAATNVNNSANPISFDFPNESNFSTDGSTPVKWEIAFALVKRNSGVRSGADNYCIRGRTGGATADVTATPATCESGGTDGQLSITGFSDGEKFDFNAGTTYTGSATFATATPIPTDGIIASNLPLATMPSEYTVRIFREDCFIDATVVMPPVFCPYTCDFPSATATPNPSTCTNETRNADANILLTDIVNMDRVGVSAGRTYTGPDYAAAIDLNGATTFTFDASNNVTSGDCTEYYTIRFFNGAEDAERCIVDRVVAISPVSCDGCQIICAEIVGTDSEEIDSANNNGQAEACMTDQKVDLSLSKTVDNNSGSLCDVNGNQSEFTYTITLENVGDLAANDIIIQDTFPFGLVVNNIVVSGGQTVVNPTSIRWDVAQLAPSATATMTVTAAFADAGAYENCVFVESVFPDNDPDDANDFACTTVTVTGPNRPRVNKLFSPEFTRVNVPIRLQIKLTNNETEPIALTQDFVDNLPSTPGQIVIAPDPKLVSDISGVVAPAGANQVIVPSGTVLQPGLNTILVDVVAPANGDYVNLIQPGDLQTTSCSNPDSTRAELNVSDQNVIAPMVTKSFASEMLTVGQTTTLTITVENRNPEAMTLASDFEDEMPDGIMVTGTPTSTCGGASTFSSTDLVGLTAGTTIAANSICTLTVEVQATTAGLHCNLIPFNSVGVEIATSGGPTMTANEDLAEACVEVVNDPVFDLALRKTLAAGQLDTVALGSTVTFTITVFNQGTLPATDIQITDYVAEGLTLVDDATWEMSGGNAVLTNPISLAAGAEVEIPIQFTVNTNFGGESIVNSAEISSASNTEDIDDKDSTPDQMASNDKGGSVQTPSDNVIFGNALLAGGTPGDENGLTDEDDADPAILFLVQPEGVCNLVFNVTPGDCDPADGLYDLAGSITFEDAPETGNLVVSLDGTTVQTITIPSGTELTSPQAISVTDLTSDGLNKTVRVFFDAEPACGASLGITAPENCITPVSDCTVGIEAEPGDCDEATGTYTLTGTVAFESAPSTGTMTVAVGPFTQVFSAPFVSETDFEIDGLLADGSSQRVRVSFSDEAGCEDVVGFVAPAACQDGDCAVSVTLDEPATTCVPAQNTFTLTGSVTFNDQATGPLTLSIGGRAQTINSPNSPQAFSLAGLVPDGSNQTLTVTFGDNAECKAQIIFESPETCTTPGNEVCATSLSLEPSVCSGGTYSLSGSIAFSDAPTTGQLILRDGAMNTLLTVDLPAASPLGFTLPGLVADGMESTLSVIFSEDGTCTDSQTFTAPDDCTDACELTVTPEDIDCNDNGTPLNPDDDYVTFTLNPTGTALGGSYTVTAGSESVFRTNGQLATGVDYGRVTTFRLADGTADTDGLAITVTDDDNPGCAAGPLDITSPGVCSEAECSVVLTATPGDCETTGGTYDLSVRVLSTNAPATGSLIVSVDGAVVETLTTFTADETVTVEDLTADGQQHTVTAEFTDDAGCRTELGYRAPASCLPPVTTNCSVEVTATPGDCDPLTGRYSLSGTVTFTNPPASGTIQVMVGAFMQALAIDGSGSADYEFTGLLADGSGNTVKASFSDDPGCQNEIDFVAPIGCMPDQCGLTLTAMTAECEVGTNTFEIGGTVEFVNPPATGDIVVAIGSQQMTVAIPASGNTASFTFSGLLADGREREVEASFSADTDCAATIDITAPEDCGPTDPGADPVCVVSLDAEPSPCSGGEYTLSGTISFVDPPATGNVILREGSVDLQVIPVAAGSPVAFSLPGLPADGEEHTIVAFFGADTDCSAELIYLAPEACVDACDLMASVSAETCNDNGTDDLQDDDYLTFELDPTGTGLGTGYTITASGVVVSRLNGMAATNVPYGAPMTFRLPNGSAGNGNVELTVTDATNPDCTTTVTVVDPGMTCSEACSLEITAATAVCEEGETGKFDVTVALTFTNGPGGTITVQLGNGESAESEITAAGNGTATVVLEGVGEQVATELSVNAFFTGDTDCAATEETVTVPTECCPEPQTICEDLNESFTLTAEAGLTNYQWFQDDVAIAGGNMQTYIATEAGTYTWSAQDPVDDCPVTSCCPTVLEPLCDEEPGCDVIITITDISSCVNGDFVFMATLQWAMAPEMGNVEYQVDGTGPWIELTRTEFGTNATETFDIPDLACNEAEKIAFRFAEFPECFVEAMFIFPPSDPAGYIYCVETGEIVTGGTIDVMPPAGGSFALVDSQDGTDGRYVWVATGSPVTLGDYMMVYTPPAGFANTGTPGERAGDTDDVLDPTPGSEDNPDGGPGEIVNLGSDVNTAEDMLLDFSAAANPFFLKFSLGQDDPFVDLNNIPLIGCTDCASEQDGDDLGGVAFEDTDHDGEQDDTEVGRPDVVVEVYDCDDQLVCSTITNELGEWFCALDAEEEEQFRVEFSTLDDELARSSTVGEDNGTNVRFVTVPDCEVDYGVNDASDLDCQADPLMATACYAFGPADGENADEPALVSFRYSANFNDADGNTGGVQEHPVLATVAEVGTLYGVAYDEEGNLYTGAFVKRHADIGPGGTGMIYRITPDGTLSQFVDLGGAAGGADPHAGNSTENDWLLDAGAIDAVFKSGLGDMDYDPVTNALYTVGLANKSLYRINLDDASVDGPFAIPAQGCGDADWQPFAVDVNDGVVYVGGTCTGQSTGDIADVSASILSFNPETEGFSDPIFSIEDFTPVGFPRAATFLRWRPWSSNPFAELEDPNSSNALFPQPVLADIEFVGDDLVIGIRDRMGDQSGVDAPGPNNENSGMLYDGRANGDILRAGGSPHQGWVLERNGTISGLTSTISNSGGGQFGGETGADFDIGPGGANNSEFYDDSHDFDWDNGLGGLLQLDDRPGEILTSQFDPTQTNMGAPYGVFFNSGVRVLSNTDGSFLRSYDVVLSSSVQPTPFFGKAAGIGDIAAFCGPAPIQLGNYVWIDENEDGDQDACEEPVDGLPVRLYKKAENGDLTLVATTMTDEDGEYYFTNSDDPDETWEDPFTEVEPDMTYVIAFGDETVNDELLEVDGELFSLTTLNDGAGTNPDLNDSDAELMTAIPVGAETVTLPTICYSTADSTDHSHDVGLVPSQLLSLGSTIFEDLNNNGVQDVDDSGIPGVSVQLYDAGADMEKGGGDDTEMLVGPDGILGNVDDAAGGMLTNDEGFFFFQELPPGKYYVEVGAGEFVADGPLENIPISSNTASGLFSGETDPDDNEDGDDEGLQPDGPGTVTCSGVVELSVGEEPTDDDATDPEDAPGNLQDNDFDANGNMTLDMGFFAPVCVGDTAFVDLDENGLQSAGDLPLEGVTVTLFDSETMMPVTGMDLAGNAIEPVMTGAMGEYKFANLPPGDYFVVFDITTVEGPEFLDFTDGMVGGDPAIDSDADPANPDDDTAPSEPTGLIPSGGEDLSLDVGVVCIIDVVVAQPFTICGNQVIDLLSDASITSMSLGGFWTTADGTGQFLDTDGNPITGEATFGVAATYAPSAEDARRGSVTLTLTTNDPGDGSPCEAVGESVTIEILKVDCGTFPWNGEDE